MNEMIKPMAQWASAIAEALGISVIVFLAVVALVSAAIRFVRKERRETLYVDLRQQLGRGILLGLELLVAADIIHTVAVELTFETVGVLGVIVLIRTFLSFTLEVELSGYWPWQKKGKKEH